MIAPGRARVHILVLGGTGDALELAGAASRHPALDVTTSFAGRTRRPRLPAGRIRIGGFGGAEGLRSYLERRRIGAVVDATHPFAIRISAHARDASASARCPLLTLARASWSEAVRAGARSANDLADALAMAPPDGRILVTFGPEGPTSLAGIPGARLVVRCLEVPKSLPPGATWIAFRPTSSPTDERGLFARLGIGAVIAKASGGAATAAKLEAAMALDLPVILIRRPAPPQGEVVRTVADALAWMLAQSP